MVPMASSSPKPSERDVPIEELVFSCTICQATVSEVYATTESSQGFHSGSGDEDGIVTKMWITECSHVTCAKHLENGAAPFYPKGLAPRAPCPKCFKDKTDETPKALYGIRGLGEGEYDAAIPSEWRQCPAIKLDNSVPGMLAVRFQYLAVSHYAQQVRKHWKSAVQKQSAMETSYAKERKQRRQLQSEVEELRQRVQTLESSEAKLKKWEERKPMIYHYLGMYGRITSDIESMRKQLLQFGVNLPETKYAFEPTQIVAQQRQPSKQKQPHTAPRVLKASETFISAPVQCNDTSSVRKRKREHDISSGHYENGGQTQRTSRASRDLMPPPLPKPKPQLSERRELPISHSTMSVQETMSSRRRIQDYQNSHRRSDQEDPFRNQTRNMQEIFQIPNSMQSQATLPYRPVIPLYDQTHANQQEESPYATGAHRIEPDFHKTTATNMYTDQSPAYHTSQLQHSLKDSVYSSPNYRIPISNGVPFGWQDAHNQTMSLDSGYKQTVPPQDERIRAPLQLLSDCETNRQPYNISHAGLSHVARSIQQASHISGRTTPSPFFWRDEPATRSPAIQQAHSTSGLEAPRYVASTRDGAAQNPTMTFHAQQRNHIQPQTGNNVYSMDNSRQQTNLHRRYDSLFRGSNSFSRLQPKTAIPQTPRNFQGLFHRPGCPPPSASYTTTGPPSNANHSWLTKQESHGSNMPVASTQDETLLQVPGVRGMSSQRGVLNYQRPRPAHGDPRNLFSSAGGRRSVRR